MSSNKTIDEIVKKDSDSESVIGVRLIDECSDVEILNYSKRLKKRTLSLI